MNTYEFKTPAVKTIYGTAFFQVVAPNKEQAMRKLQHDASEYLVDFTESDGCTEWDNDFEEA